MRYNKIRKMDISNGEGVGVALFVQGCHFHCEGCFNPETWSFDGGQQWDSTTEKRFLELVNKPYITRVSILGGEPLCDENVEVVDGIVSKIKTTFPDKSIWVFTGYDYEDIVTVTDIDWYNWRRMGTIRNIDVLVDGKFDISKQDLYNEKIVFAGSYNQRIIDVQKSLQEQKVVLK